MQDKCLSMEMNFILKTKTYSCDSYTENVEEYYILKDDITVLPLTSVTHIYSELPIYRQQLFKRTASGSIVNLTDRV